ncbi:MFS transporter [Knoellia sp. CPCC 206453]|uniref:MFS transporter n=1 Tax=Knoellia pratensis TaxID=3404796 RepID=UPI00360B06A5
MPSADDFSLRRIALPAFGPTAVWSVGVGASVPVVALSARNLGASIALAAAFVLIEGVAAFVSSLPAGSLVARVGERRALAGAAVVDAVGAALAVFAPNLWTLGVAIGLMGMTGSVFLLARQSWLTARAPVRIRARAMSTMGGVQRVGLFVGPFVAAPIIHVWGTQAAYAVAVVAGLSAAVWAWFGLRDADDVGDQATSGADGRGGAGDRVRLIEVVRDHRRVLMTIGVGVLLIGAARQGRFVIVPLWAESVGITDSQTALIFGIAGGAEVLLFYPAGSVMDRFGRVWVAVPFLVVLGVGMVLLPLSHGFAAVAAVSTLMGIGNGLGSGIVQTLGADAAPVVGRAQFLSAWRFLSLIGQNGAPLLVSGVTVIASLGVACVVLGLLVLGGAPWLARWLPAYDPRRAAVRPVRP